MANFSDRTLGAIVDALSRSFPAITFNPPAEGDDWMVEIDGWVYITKGEIDWVTRSILGTHTERVEGYVVSKVSLIRGSHWEPDDYDVSDESEHRNLYHAVRAAMELVLMNQVDGAIEYAGETLYAEECQNPVEVVF